MTDPALLGRLMHDAFNNRDFDAIDRIFAPDFYSHPLGAGRDALRAAWKMIVQKYPDARTSVDHVIGDGDTVALRATVHGIGSDKQSSTLLEMFRVADGRIIEIWGATADGHRPVR